MITKTQQARQRVNNQPINPDHTVYRGFTTDDRHYHLIVLNYKLKGVNVNISLKEVWLSSEQYPWVVFKLSTPDKEEYERECTKYLKPVKE